MSRPVSVGVHRRMPIRIRVAKRFLKGAVWKPPSP